MPRTPKREVSCPDTGLVPALDTQGPFRPVPRCDPPTVVPVPEYRPAVPDTPATPAPSLPDALEYMSPEVTVSCSEWPDIPAGGITPSGSPVTVAAGEYRESLYIQNLGLPRDDVYFIARRLSSELAAVRQLIDDGDPIPLAALLSVSTASATLITDAAAAITARLASQARELALSLLDCRWYNEVVAVSCPEGADTGGNNPSLVAERTYSSSVSQEDADNQAREAALANLVCRYGNDRTTVVCADLDPSLSSLDPGNTTQTPGQSPGIDPTQVFRNSATLEAGQVFSNISKAEANALAREYLLTQLRCFFILATPTLAVCQPDEDGIPAEASVPPVTFDGTSFGNPVLVPANYVYSDISMDDAQAQATALAESSLRCLWTNCRLTYSCEDRQSDSSDPLQVAAHCAGGAYDNPYVLANKKGVEVYVGAFDLTVEIFALPGPSADGYSHVVEAGDFPSEISHRDANRMAADYALSQLDCVYCNPRIESPCPVTSTTYTMKVEGVSYYVGGLVANGAQVLPFEDIFALAEGHLFGFCGSDAQTVVFQADEQGKIAAKDLISAATACEFQNTDTYGSCFPADIAAAPDTWSWWNPLTQEFEDRPTQKVGSPATDPAHLAAGSTHLRFVKHGSFFSSTQEDADYQAAQFLLSELHCYYENTTQTATCEGGPGVAENLVGTYTVPAGTYQSDSSQADANTMAMAEAQSMLVCMYCSEEVTNPDCPHITLPACTCYSSVDTAEATEKAWALMAAILGVLEECPDGGGGGGGGGSGGSAGSDGGSGTGGSGSGSDKSTAIVPAPWQPSGYAALFTHEMPEVRFDDVMRIPITGDVTVAAMDSRYVYVCEPDTIWLDSAVGDTGPILCARVEGTNVVVQVGIAGMRPKNVVVRLTGVRRGFRNLRFPSRSKLQFVMNEMFIQSAYPRSQD